MVLDVRPIELLIFEIESTLRYSNLFLPSLIL